MKNEEPETIRDGDILPLWSYQRPDPPPENDHQPDAPEPEGDTRIEAFWAGRNHAMRHSARWAA